MIYLILSLLIQQLPDGAPPYRETNLSFFIVEPWNAISSLTFLIPVIYWFYKLRGRYKEYLFISFAMPLLLLGGLGSTLFHAFRNSRYLLMMDVLPILVLTLCLSIYFWYHLVHKWEYTLVIISSFFLGNLLTWYYIPSPYSTNISYFIRGVMMFLPCTLLLYKTNFYGAFHIITAITLFILALVFRQLDSEIAFYGLPMGTHWLWHISTAVGAGFLAEYLFRFANYQKTDLILDNM